VELPLALPTAALPARRALMLLAADGPLGLTVNDARPLNRRRAPSGNLFPVYVNPDRWNSEPEHERCTVFMLDPHGLRPGGNTVRATNAGRSNIEIQRLDLGLWYR